MKPHDEIAAHSAMVIPSSAWDLYPLQSRALAYIALCLFEALETEPYEAPYGLDFKLRLFRHRMIRELSADQGAVPDGRQADPWRGEMDEPVVFGGGPA